MQAKIALFFKNSRLVMPYKHRGATARTGSLAGLSENNGSRYVYTEGYYYKTYSNDCSSGFFGVNLVQD